MVGNFSWKQVLDAQNTSNVYDKLKSGAWFYQEGNPHDWGLRAKATINEGRIPEDEKSEAYFILERYSEMCKRFVSRNR
jgi:hypothetical protein